MVAHQQAIQIAVIIAYVTRLFAIRQTGAGEKAKNRTEASFLKKEPTDAKWA